MPGYFQDLLFTRLRRGKPNKKLIKQQVLKNNKDRHRAIISEMPNICYIVHQLTVVA